MNQIPKIFLMSAAMLTATTATIPAPAQLSSNVHVWVTGLNGPRGLKFGPNGSLYVAEAGTGGTISTVGRCGQVIPPVGPYMGGNTARISRIDSSGNRTTVASGFPSSVNALGSFQGVADLAFVDGKLYALLGGAGCSHGNLFPNALLNVNLQNGTWTMVANLSNFIKTHSVKFPSPDDFEPDGTFYSMIPFNHRLYAVEPNHGQILSIGLDGTVRSVMDVSATQGHIVPTSLAERGGELYMGNLNLFPIDPQWARILTLSYAECNHIAAPGLDDEGALNQLHVLGSKAGFTTVVSVAFGPDGLLYVLELSDAAGNPAPFKGKVVRVKADGSIEAVATGLSVPTAMTFGPNGDLFVSNWGAGGPGQGQIVRIDIP